MTKQQKINNLARKMGVALTTAGIKMIKSAFHIDPTMITYEQMKEFLTDITDGKLNYISLADQNYYLIPWEQWKQIIEVDWTDKKKYLKDKFDCDNFAFLFAARMAEIYDINSAGVVHGKVNVGHFWNAIVAKDSMGNLRLYYYEPMKDLYTEFKKGEKVVMGSWTYKSYSLRFF